MWQRFTEDARKVVFYAQEEAGRLGEHYVGSPHLLLGITREIDMLSADPSVAIVLLEQLGVDVAALHAEMLAQTPRGSDRLGRDMQLTPRAKRVIDLAYDEARQLKHSYIGTEHLLLGLLRETDGTTFAVLSQFGVTLDAVRLKLPELLADKSSKEQLLTLDEAVKFLGTSKPTLYRLLGQDEIKGLKVGRQWRFRKSDLVAYMERDRADLHARVTDAAAAVAAMPREDLEKALAFLNHEMTHSDPVVNDDETLLPAQLARQIIAGALKASASDVHLEPDAEGLRVRYRTGSELREALHLPVSLRGPVIAEYKTAAGLNAGETQLPQDGRMLFTHEGRRFDIGVFTLPSVSGEAVTLHISDSSTARLSTEQLGLTPEDLKRLRALTHQSKGIVLATGPAGSGRTTLLYAYLSEVAGADKKTLTIEDPVAFPLPYVTQMQVDPMQVNPSAGLTIAAVLRAFLRQDADIILAARLDDLETLGLAMEAALRGHLVLAAADAEGAVSALTSLLELGAKPPLVAATVTGIVAMRRIRKVCNACKQPVDVSALPALKALISQAAEGSYPVPVGTMFFQAIGCEQCRGRGYIGEMGLYEVLTMTEPLAEAVLRRAPVNELTAIAVSDGMRTLLADGVQKAAAGKTTLEEVLRVAS